jgi:hypothetical protein
MKTIKLTILLIISLLLSSCGDEDVAQSKAILSEKVGTNDIYSINPFNHIVFKDSGIYHYITSRWSEQIHYKYKIK